MVRTTMLVAAVTVAVAAAGSNAGFAQAPHHKPAAAPRYYICTARPPEFDPRDLNQMRASVSAASRLALAIREREFLASCRPVPRRYRYHAG